ncbi:MAG: hypothetical protein ACREI3_13205 [Nitrospirales bacterium]
MPSAKRIFKKLTVLSLILFFAIGVWCAIPGAPDLSVAWGQFACSKTSSSLGQAECEYPGFICASGSLTFDSALASIRTDGSSRDTHFSIINALDTRSYNEFSLRGGGLSAAALFNPAQKVSVHLFNSVLTC